VKSKKNDWPSRGEEKQQKEELSKERLGPGANLATGEKTDHGK